MFKILLYDTDDCVGVVVVVEVDDNADYVENIEEDIDDNDNPHIYTLNCWDHIHNHELVQEQVLL